MPLFCCAFDGGRWFASFYINNIGNRVVKSGSNVITNLAGGTQAERNSALRRLASGEHRHEIVEAGKVELSDAELINAKAFSAAQLRLWDVDRLINRSLVYFTVTVVLAGVFGNEDDMGGTGAPEWLIREGAALGLDPRRLAVGGDSAGGTLEAACAQSVNQLLAICDALQKVAIQQGSALKDLARLAAKTCDECEKACRKHADKHAECKACADACADCVKECKAVAA